MSMRMLALCGSLTSCPPPAVQYTIARAKWLFKLFRLLCGWSLGQKKKKKEREGTDIYLFVNWITCPIAVRLKPEIMIAQEYSLLSEFTHFILPLYS